VLSEEGGIAVRSGRFCAHIYMDRLLAGSPTKGDGPQPTGAVRASIGLYNDESDIERLLEYVAKVQTHKWAGRYRMKGDSMSAEFAGRCADRWMEATHEAEGMALGEEVGAPRGYEFEILQPDGGCRSYLIADPETRQAAIVDPLRERVDDYLDLLQAKRYQLVYTIETHTHADHLSGSPRLKDLTGAKMLMHAGTPVVCVDRGLSDGDTIQLGNLTIDVIATPGHTHDSVCLVLPDRVLTGDTLLIGGCGRTDLPSGDAIAMFHSLKRLLDLPDDTAVFPAHDYDGRRATTIGRERKQNPRLKLPTVEEFSGHMNKMNLPKPPNIGEVLQTNQRCLID
jgi:glyoxylase-like metal-dependent hydrolase (beta-lactamase superfamily II)